MLSLLKSLTSSSAASEQQRIFAQLDHIPNAELEVALYDIFNEVWQIIKARQGSNEEAIQSAVDFLRTKLGLKDDTAQPKSQDIPDTHDTHDTFSAMYLSFLSTALSGTTTSVKSSAIATTAPQAIDRNMVGTSARFYTWTILKDRLMATLRVSSQLTNQLSMLHQMYRGLSAPFSVTIDDVSTKTKNLLAHLCQYSMKATGFMGTDPLVISNQNLAYLCNHAGYLADLQKAVAELKQLLSQSVPGMNSTLSADFTSLIQEIEVRFINPCAEIVAIAQNCNLFYTLLEYRYKKYMLDKNRNPIQAETTGLTSEINAQAITGFKDAINDYKKYFMFFINRYNAQHQNTKDLFQFVAILANDNAEEKHVMHFENMPENIQKHCLGQLIACIQASINKVSALNGDSFETFIEICREERRIKKIIFYLNAFVKANSQEESQAEILQLNSEALNKEIDAQNDNKLNPLSFAEVDAVDRRIRKQQEKLRREEKQERLKVNQSLTFTKEIEKRSGQAKLDKQIQLRESLFSHFEELKRENKSLVLDLLNTKVAPYDSFEEGKLVAVLDALGLEKKETGSGYIFAIDTETFSFHDPHGKDKVNGKFIMALRKLFNDIGFTQDWIDKKNNPADSVVFTGKN